MLQYLEKHPILLLTLVVTFMLIINLSVPSVTIMEARNFITAKEMVTDNHWLLTTMNGEARYEKPPLPTWLSAISGLIFGISNVFALRLPAAFMVLFLGAFLYKLSLKLTFSTQHSLLNGLIVITSFYVFAIINEAPWDIYTHGFMLAGIYYLFLVLEEKKHTWKNSILSAIFIGFSILSKGPISLYALYLPFLISYGFTFKFKEMKRIILPFFAIILLSIIIGGWWFVYVRLADPTTFLKIATTETSNWSTYNVKPFYYYWSFFTQSGIWTLPAFISLIYPYILKKTTYKKEYTFSFLWVIIAVLLLSIIPEKKPRYLMPVLIPLALNIGIYLNYLIQNFSKITSKKEKLAVYFSFGSIALLSFAIPIVLVFLMKSDLKQHLVTYILLVISCLTISFFLIKNLKLKNLKNVFYFVILFMIVIALFGLPISKSFNKNNDYNSFNHIKQFETKHAIKTYSLGMVTPELIWDYNEKIINIFNQGKLTLPTENNFGLLVKDYHELGILPKLSLDYNIELITTVNLNEGSKIKSRLIQEYYLLSKK